MTAVGTAEAVTVSSATATPGFSLAQAQQEFQQAIAWISSPEVLRQPLHEIEVRLERRGREVQRLLLQAHVQMRGTGAVAEALELKMLGEGGGPIALTHRREHTCEQQTVVGPIRIVRTGYARPGKASVHPLDGELQLPGRSFSYEVQKRLVLRAAQGPFRESVEALRQQSGFGLSTRSVQQILRDAAEDVDAFYQQRQPEAPDHTGPIVVGTVDGKGVPMVKPHVAQRVLRRGKGEKAQKKNMATVAAVYTVQPHVRRPEEVVANLFEPARQEPKAPRPRPEGKRVWASLKKGKERVIEEVQEEMKRRDPGQQKKRVVITDGERALQKRVKNVFGAVLLILDFLHVLEHLWKAAYAFHKEGSPEAAQWVRDRAMRVLKGEVSQVVKGMGQSATKRGLRGEAKRTVEATAKYLYRNRKFMRYHEYLAEGLPIASGAVEGACKNVIKDRMERSGMRWTHDTAEAMLKLRATYLSGDYEEYWAFHIRQDQQRLYGSRAWRKAA